MGTTPEKDDKLLWRLRRSLIEAKNISSVTVDDYRRTLVLTAEIRGHIKLLNERLGLIEDEMRAVNHRVGAMNAYRKVASFVRGPAKGRGKGVN